MMTMMGTYQRALSIEFDLRGLRHVRELEMDLWYKGQSIGTRRVDMFVENTVMVELKAVGELDDAHLAQAINYLEASGLEVGLLINFGGRSLEFRRVMPPYGRLAKPAGTLRLPEPPSDPS